MSEIIKASDAKQLAKDSSRIIAEKELSEVYDGIRKACKEGQLCYVHDKALSTHALNRLIELGYTYDGSKTKSGYKISWA